MAEEQHSEADLPPLKIDETERIIARLEQVVRDRRVVLVGGQAVAIWEARRPDRGHAWRQLRASILCARAFSQLLLDERGEDAVRDVLRLNERIFRFAQEDRCSRLAAERGIDAFDAVLDDERLPEKFRTVRLLQMRERIRTLRKGLSQGEALADA